MFRHICLVFVILLASSPEKCCVSSGGAPGDTVLIASSNRYNTHTTLPSSASSHKMHQQHSQHHSSSHAGSGPASPTSGGSHSAYHHSAPGSGHIDHRNSYNLLSEAMSQAVSNEFSSLGSGSADGACHADDLDCYSGNIQDRLGMEAIRTLHRQLDDDDNGNIDLSESDDFLREELKYDSGYEKRQKAFHFNDDMHISVKELWEAWLRSEVHNWTIEQTTDWLAQSVQLPQYVDLFKVHKVTGAALPRLAVSNMHYVGNVLGIKDPIHKQKIALKAMDVVLFGPPRETGTRWKDYILVTLLLSAIIGCWYAYQQNKNAKRHLRRMAQDMEGLQRAEQSLQEMQKELERARMEQENVATEKLDLERRLKEAPSLSSSSSDLEVQQLKKEIEMLRKELSRAEIELVDNCWSPPPQLQSWLQYTYELESKNHLKKRVSAEKQLQSAREACEKLRKKRSSLVGAFVSTHGKSIDDVDRSIVEARNSLGEVTNELQERLHRWKQIETCMGFNIVNNNGLPYLESVLYGRANGSSKGSRGRMTNSTDDLDDESVQGMVDSYSRNSVLGGSSLLSSSNASASGGGGGGGRDDSSCSDDGEDRHSVHFFLGGAPTPPLLSSAGAQRGSHNPYQSYDGFNNHSCSPTVSTTTSSTTTTTTTGTSATTSTTVPMATILPAQPSSLPPHSAHSHPNFISTDSVHNIGEENQRSPSASSERSIPIPPRTKKPSAPPALPPPPSGQIGRAPLPPPRRSNQSHIIRSQSTDLVPMEIYSYLSRQQAAASGSLGHIVGQQQQLQQQQYQHQQQQSTLSTTGASILRSAATAAQVKFSHGKMVKQHSTTSQQSSSSTSSIHSAPSTCGTAAVVGSSTALRWSSSDRINRPFSDGGEGGGVGGGGDMEPLIESTTTNSHFIGTPSITPTKPIGQVPVGMQSLYNMTSGNIAAISAKNIAAAPAHRDTKLEETANSTDSSSLDGELKKRRRKLRFPFGKKTSSKNKLA